MRSDWRDGGRERVVELKLLGAGRYRARVDGVELEVTLAPAGNGRWRLTSGEATHGVEVSATAGRTFVRLDTMDFVLERARAVSRRGRAANLAGLESPMPGVVTRVMVAPGERVAAAQPLLAIEAMKMEHVIRAPHAGTVRSLAAKVGEMVTPGVPLAEIDASDPIA